MKLNWLAGALLATAFSVSASAQVSVYIGTPPPPLRIEQRGVAPGPGYAWVEGYWAPNGHHYRWVAGRWDHPPYEGAYWNHPHYDHYQQGWRLHEGTGTTRITTLTKSAARWRRWAPLSRRNAPGWGQAAIESFSSRVASAAVTNRDSRTISFPECPGLNSHKGSKAVGFELAQENFMAAAIPLEPVPVGYFPPEPTQSVQARALQQEGESPSEIATNLSTAVATIDGYLGIAVPQVASVQSPEPVQSPAAEPVISTFA